MAFEIPAAAFKRTSFCENSALKKFDFGDIITEEDLDHGSFGSTYRALYQGSCNV